MSNNDFSQSRRAFLEQLACYGATVGSLPWVLENLGLLGTPVWADEGMPKEVEFYKKLPNRQIQCQVCPMNCILNAGETCFCRTRTNHDGVLYTHAFNNPCVLKVDPIEKLPLHHYLPETTTLSIATGGCNLRCLYCQNWEFSQKKPAMMKTFHVDHNKATRMSLEKKIQTIAYTYTEPVVFSEYISDLAQYTQPFKIHHVAATALFINPEPLKAMCKYISAFTVALKSFREEFYKNVCGQSLKPVLNALEILRATGVWFEIVTLVLPTYNDSTAEIKDLCRWVFRNLGPDVPIHFERFVPEYKLRNLPRTPVKTLEEARNIAFAEGLRYVYISNLAPHVGNNTYCFSCKNLLIERLGFKILHNYLQGGKCPKCSQKIAGIWAKS